MHDRTTRYSRFYCYIISYISATLLILVAYKFGLIGGTRAIELQTGVLVQNWFILSSFRGNHGRKQSSSCWTDANLITTFQVWPNRICTLIPTHYESTDLCIKHLNRLRPSVDHCVVWHWKLWIRIVPPGDFFSLAQILSTWCFQNPVTQNTLLTVHFCKQSRTFWITELWREDSLKIIACSVNVDDSTLD